MARSHAFIQKLLKNIFYHDTEILEVNLFAFAYKLFHEDFYPLEGPVEWREIFMKHFVGKCK